MHRPIPSALPVVLLCFLLHSSTTLAEVPTECEERIADLRNFSSRPDGSMAESRASSTRYCVFDESLTVDEFRALAPSGEPIFHGVSLTQWAPSGDGHRVLWVMVGDPGFTFLDNRVDRSVPGHVLRSEGSGADGMGQFRERSRTTWQEDGTSEFVMDRYYDRMGRWIEPFNRIVTTPSDRPSPPHPTEASPMLSRGQALWPELGETTTERSWQSIDGRRRQVTERQSTYFILDGHALLSETEWVAPDSTATPRRWIRYYTVDPRESQWRVVTWELGTDDVEVATTPITP